MSANSQYDEQHDEGAIGYYRDLLMNEPGNPDHVDPLAYLNSYMEQQMNLIQGDK